jgi:hypothetical protein
MSNKLQLLVVIILIQFHVGCQIEFLDYSEFENSIWLVQAIHVASDVAISVYLTFVARFRFASLVSLLHFVSAHPFIFRFLSIWERLPAIACDTRPVEHALLVSLRAFAFICIVNIQLIIYV